MLAKVKAHSEAELRRFKEESEASYQSGVCEHVLLSSISSLCSSHEQCILTSNRQLYYFL